MSGSSPKHQSSTVWKVLHGAPPTPPPARRDPDRHPQPHAGQQQKEAAAAAAAALQVSSPAGQTTTYRQQQPTQYQQQTHGLSSSAVSLQLSPSLHNTTGRHQPLQHSSSMDDGFLHLQQTAYQADMPMPVAQNKQGWPTLSSPKGQANASSPWGKLPSVSTASSPDHDLHASRTQVCRLVGSSSL